MGARKLCVGKNFRMSRDVRKLQHRSLGGLLHHANEGGPPNPPMQGRVITGSHAWLVLPPLGEMHASGRRFSFSRLHN